ncbi:hypothetical protein Tco_0008774 [Tanacetum coccineum]
MVAGKAVTPAKAITESIHEAEIHDIKGLLDEAKDNISGMKIVKDPSGDCIVEKNDKWSYTYVVGSQVYQGVCMRSDIESADVAHESFLNNLSRVYDTYWSGKGVNLAKETLNRVRSYAKVRDSKGVKGLLLGYTTRFAIEGFLKVLALFGLNEGFKTNLQGCRFFAKSYISKGF